MSDDRQDITFHPDVLQLREERAQVQVIREPLGQVTVQRKREVRTENFTVDLVTETLHLTLSGASNAALQVVIEGERAMNVILLAGETHEVELYREEAHIQKQVVVYEQVRLGKRAITEHELLGVDLQREVLDVQQTVYVTGEDDPRA